jgi:hypothetical protein
MNELSRDKVYSTIGQEYIGVGGSAKLVDCAELVLSLLVGGQELLR